MTDSVSFTGLFVALALPWLCGCILTGLLLRGTSRRNAFIVLGQGFFLGTFLVTLVIRLWDAMGFTLDFLPIAALVCVLCILGLLPQVLRPRRIVAQRDGDRVPPWHIGVATVLFALIAWRYATLAQEMLLRPLYAWDAWMNWVPKAITWFHHRSLVDFVSPQQWLTGTEAEAYTLGNPQASPYPITVPLIQLWAMLGVGDWDETAVFLPWILAPIALGLALYGHLRLAGVPFLMAVIACYALLSLPYLNVHTVLAGYADLWVAAAFCLAVCAMYEWRQSRHWGYTVLWLVLALMCGLLKNPGIVLALILLLFGVRGWMAVAPRLEIAALAVLGSLAALAMVFGFSLDIPYIGRIAVGAGAIDVGKLGHFELAYHAVGPAFLETFFVMINWHLLWYLLLPMLLYCIYRRAVLRWLLPEILTVLSALGFVAFVFVFSRHYEAALNFVTLNRALMYCVPALIYCLFLCFQKRDARI